MKVYPIPKPGKKKKRKRETDEPYLEFIRQQPCLICDQKSVPHHEPIKKGTSGTGSKGPDRETLPLCHFHHIEDRHRVGKITFWGKHNINYVKEIKRLQKMYTLSLKAS